MTHISSLNLVNFRNYSETALDGLASGFVTLSGHNGAGKTNILEALSLFTQSRGLRKASLEDIQNIKHQSPAWQISIELETTPYGKIPMGMRYDPENKRRNMRINKAEAKAQAAVLEYMSMLWLTPQMDGLFLDTTSERRRFFDRMIYNGFDGAHAGRIARYDNALRQRAKILQDSEEKPDPVWLDSLEHNMAETALAIAAARIDFITRLNKACASFATTGLLKSFPLGSFSIDGTIEAMLNKGQKAIACEDWFKDSLKKSRIYDASRGGAKEGPHKTDFLVKHLEKEMPAAQCSTGEQKALLTGIILSYAQMLRAEDQTMPILLLDEIAAHFDIGRRTELYDLLASFGGQVWMTGTEYEVFDGLESESQHFIVSNDQIKKHR